jgi:hypothetical protein
MCGRLLPPTRGADHRAAGGAPGSPLTWGIHSHGRLVIFVLGGELDIATAPGLAGQLDPAGHERTRTATPGASGENRETG